MEIKDFPRKLTREATDRLLIQAADDSVQHIESGDFLEGISSGSGAEEYALIVDEKPSDSSGGTFNSGSWQIRTLNTIKVAQTWLSISGGIQFTLQAGAYRIRAQAPAYRVGQHKARLFNLTSNTTQAIGTLAYTLAAEVMTSSEILTFFTLTAPENFQLQHFCRETQGGNGFGVNGGAFTGGVPEIYSTVEIWRK